MRNILPFDLLSQQTRLKVQSVQHGYVDKTHDLEREIERLIESGIERVYRFDLWENADGCSTKIGNYLNSLDLAKAEISKYPDPTHSRLRSILADRFNVSPDWIMLSTGSDSIIDFIARTILDPGDFVLTPQPCFFLFREYSERMGARTLYVPLKEENDFEWTAETGKDCAKLIHQYHPKLIWIDNPNNPSGKVISKYALEEVITTAAENNVFVVIDEAYGEYSDTDENIYSAADFTKKYDNVIVLRTFSKAHGLASIRIGYCICSSKPIIDAIKLYRHNFPISKMSLDIAEIAFSDDEFIRKTRSQVKSRAKVLFQELKKIPDIHFIPSSTSIFLLKHKKISATELALRFKAKGIIISKQNIAGLTPNIWARITIRSHEDNTYFIKACQEINREIALENCYLEILDSGEVSMDMESAETVEKASFWDTYESTKLFHLKKKNPTLTC